MTTYTFTGYNFTDYVPVSGAPNVGATFRISPDFDAATDAITFTVTDDDTTLSGGSGSIQDATQQTATVTDALGSTLYSGTIRIGWEATFTLPDGSTVHVWDVWTGDSGGSRIGLIADAELPPGVTFQITDYVEGTSSAVWPSYSAISDPTTDPDSSQTILGGNLADSLYGGDGDDSIDGGAGNDTIDGGAGNDTIDGGTENDAIYGGTGDDSLTGGSGDDQIWGDDGADTLSGGAGSDNLTGGAGDDLFLISDADDFDNIDGGTETDTIEFSSSTQGVTVTWSGVTSGSYDFDATTGSGSFNNVESITGTDYDDTFNASGAGSGVSVDGGAGDDVFTGSNFADSLTGGLGNDTITTGTGADTISMTSGDGVDTVTDFDLTGLGSGPTTDQLDTSALTGGTGTGGTVRAFDVVVTDDGSGNALLTFPSGEQLLLTGVAPASISSASSLHAMGIPCFVAGTQIATPSGPRKVESLRPGDLVLTRDHGAQPVLWAAGRTIAPLTLANRVALRPVEILANALGNTRPLRVSAQHAVLAEIGGTPQLLRAKHLAEFAPHLARVLQPNRAISYHHLLLPTHALICAEGVWSESLWPGPMAFAALSPADKAGLLRLRPDLAAGLLGLAPIEPAYGPPAQPILRRRALRHLLGGRLTA
ncbi:hemolysin type calcium-binding protein [Rhodobacter sp. JA431]|uniref:Hint domain-containing protein n=1 Tax=Rhodobacter sp. JA431 TaxID=570013 RepID=UPI000BD030BC|nr:Hint domain-containing protein [Rhodobacter sp. JA431]SOB91205.1 hemolysin type calcium-binding protein [Rhodobacter sp. JA431]